MSQKNSSITFDLNSRWAERAQQSADVRRFHIARRVFEHGRIGTPIELGEKPTADAHQWLNRIGTAAACAHVLNNDGWKEVIICFLNGTLDESNVRGMCTAASEFSGGDCEEAARNLCAAAMALVDKDPPAYFESVCVNELDCYTLAMKIVEQLRRGPLVASMSHCPNRPIC